MMSRSYRQPFQAITGSQSAKQDKIRAHRGERRLLKRAIKAAERRGFDDFLLPHKFEAYWNNNYKWDRDGRQIYVMQPQHSRSDLTRAFDPQHYEEWLKEEQERYRRLLRK